MGILRPSLSGVQRMFHGRDKIKIFPEEHQPKWMKQEITNSTEADYSVSLQLDENTVAILAAVGVHRGRM